jgi:hypothetical protein
MKVWGWIGEYGDVILASAEPSMQTEAWGDGTYLGTDDIERSTGVCDKTVRRLVRAAGGTKKVIELELRVVPQRKRGKV